ncbi:epsin-3 isoform X2 [Syngnathus scovelli]|uniref:epsin-3 isoform X2 n=1 Tax=Syngnathus scovelli TaxID=161590 RepID=UPI00210F7062|nr:epsin-2 isoform X2 [Syngnathus scovelli]
MGKLHLLKACSSLTITLTPPSPVNMTTSALRRQVKNIVHNYSEAEIKVREATSNDPWGPPSSLMSEIADLTFNVVAFAEVMGMVWKRLNDSGKNWRHVYKSLTLLDYLLKTGSERVAQQCRENAFTIQTLRDFQYVDRDGRDQGANVREKSRQLVCLLRDEDRLRQERTQALKTKERMAGGAGSGGGAMYGGIPSSYHPGRRTSQPSMAALYGEELSRSRGSPSSFNCERSVDSLHCVGVFTTIGQHHFAVPELLLLHTHLFALALHQHTNPYISPWHPPYCPSAASTSSPQDASELEQARPQTTGEEELQLQLALAMSREENQKMPTLQERRCRHGDVSVLQKVVIESRRASQSGTQESTMLDLVDVFGASSERPPPPGDPWDAARPSCNITSDPWDSVAVPSSNAANPWAPWADSCREPWEAAPTCNPPVKHTWESSNERESNGTYMESPHETEKPQQDVPQLSPPQPESQTDSEGRETEDMFCGADDPFRNEAPVKPLLNGRDSDSPEMLDPSRLAPPVSTTPRMCQTPEAFLGPTGASLVNLDTLIPPTPPSKAHNNPFLSGLSSPSPTNPFHCDQPRLTLNQMRPSSTSPLPPHMLSYSPSLPLPLLHRGSTLPSSQTQPPARLMDLPSNLLQPMLPLPSQPMANIQSQAQTQRHNPFL